jgi:hypothetical protein
VSAFVLAIALAFPVIEQYRILSFQPDADRNASALAVGGLRETIQDVDGSAQLALAKLDKRARQVENVAVILRDTPSVIPHTNGNTIPRALAIAVVPRVLWRDKPILDDATRFSQLYLKHGPTTRTGTGPSHFGDLYRNFGLIGVVLGMGLLGAVFAGLGRLAQRGSLRTLLIVAFGLSVLIRYEDSLNETIVAFPHILAPVLLAMLLVPGARSARSHTPG